MASVADLARRVAEARKMVEEMRAYGSGAPQLADALNLDYLMQKKTTFGAEVLAAAIPANGTFLGIFNVACPNGWTRVSALDGTFLMGAATYGTTGGASSHTHSYDDIASHTHNPGWDFGADASYHSHSSTVRAGTSAVTTGGKNVYSSSLTSNTTTSSGAHTHGISGSVASSGESSQTTSGGGTLPPYVDVVICRADT